MAQHRISRSITVHAPAAAVFDLLATPAQHPRIDGSGTVRSLLKGPDRLEIGARFGMNMRIGAPYKIGLRVVEFEEDRRIAWRHWARHIWRWELDPLDDRSTRVTETFDYSQTGPAALGYQLLGFPAQNARGIEQTLPRLKQAVEQES